MASKNFYRVQAVERETKIVNFKTKISGSGAVLATTGSGVTVTKAGTTYRVITDQPYGSVEAAQLQLESAQTGSVVQPVVTGTLNTTSGIVFGFPDTTGWQVPAYASASFVTVHGTLFLKNTNGN